MGREMQLIKITVYSCEILKIENLKMGVSID